MGKDDVAIPLALELGAEIVSVDSIKVYRGMDIGAAKPSPRTRARVPHHLIDVLDPWESYSVGRFVAEAEAAAADIASRGRIPLFVAGSGMYLRALLEGMLRGPQADPEVRQRLRRRADEIGVAALHAELAAQDPVAAARIHPNDFKRISRALEHFEITGAPISRRQVHAGRRREDRRILLFGLGRDRADLYARVRARIGEMFRLGLEAEVRRLSADPRGIGPQAREALGYREILHALEHGEPPESAAEAIRRNTFRLVRRQDTWFRRFPDTRWNRLEPASDPVAIAAEIEHVIRSEAPERPSGPSQPE